MLHRTVHDIDLLASDAERGNLHLALDALGVILIVQQHQYFALKELHIELEGFFGAPILEHQMGRQLLDMGHVPSSRSSLSVPSLERVTHRGFVRPTHTELRTSTITPYAIHRLLRD